MVAPALSAIGKDLKVCLELRCPNFHCHISSITETNHLQITSELELFLTLSIFVLAYAIASNP